MAHPPKRHLSLDYARLLRRLERPACSSIATYVGEPSLKVPIWSTKGHLLYGLVQHKALGFTISHPETVARDMESALRMERRLDHMSRQSE